MEPDAECPPAWVWRDWWLAGAVLGATAVELVVRDDMIWRPLGAVLGLAFALTMLWRRTHPLATAVIGFGAFVATDLASTAFSDEPFSLYAGVRPGARVRAVPVGDRPAGGDRVRGAVPGVGREHGD